LLTRRPPVCTTLLSSTTIWRRLGWSSRLSAPRRRASELEAERKAMTIFNACIFLAGRVQFAARLRGYSCTVLSAPREIARDRADVTMVRSEHRVKGEETSERRLDGKGALHTSRRQRLEPAILPGTHYRTAVIFHIFYPTCCEASATSSTTNHFYDL
jgi:hypothetical protein